jgi:hypothetical protein
VPVALQLLGDFRQRGQIEIGAQRPDGAEQAENHAQEREIRA